MPPFNRICILFLLYLVVSAEVNNEEYYIKQLITQIIKQRQAYMQNADDATILKSRIYTNSTGEHEEPSERIYFPGLGSILAFKAMVIGAIVKALLRCGLGLIGWGCGGLCGGTCGPIEGGVPQTGQGGIMGMLPGIMNGILGGSFGITGGISKWLQIVAGGGNWGSGNGGNNANGGGGGGGGWGGGFPGMIGQGRCLFIRPCGSEENKVHSGHFGVSGGRRHLRLRFTFGG